MRESEYLEQLFASRAQTRTVNQFVNSPGEPLTIGRISQDTGLTITTVWRMVRALERIGLVVKTKVGKALCVYTLVDSEDTRLLIEFLRMIRPFLERTLDVDEKAEVSVIES